MKSSTVTSFPRFSRRSFLQATLVGSAVITSGILSGCQVTLLDPSMLDSSIEDLLADETSPGNMIAVNDTNLYHTTIGDGTPILVMHGGLGLDHEYFRPTLDSWADFAELHYYDHRGNGRSATPDDWQTVTMETFADDAEALRNELGLDKFVLFGHSYGGFIALNYAMQYPDSLSGLILANTSANTQYASNIPEWATDEALGALNSIFTEPLESDEQWAELWSKALPLYWKDMDPGLSADVHNRTHYKADAAARSFQLLADYDLIGQMDQISVPTLILSGRHDFITGPEAHEDLHAEIPNSEIRYFERSGHFPFHTETDSYQAAVSEWIAGL